MAEWKSYASRLQGRQKAALYEYTKEFPKPADFDRLRSSVKDGSTETGKAIADAFDGAPPTEEAMLLYRGFMTDKQMEEYAALRCTNSENHVPFSFTTSLTVAENFYHGIPSGGIMVLVVPAGTKQLIDMVAVSKTPGEKEVLVGPKLTLKMLPEKPPNMAELALSRPYDPPPKIMYLTVCGQLSAPAIKEEEGEEEEEEEEEANSPLPPAANTTRATRIINKINRPPFPTPPLNKNKLPKKSRNLG